MSEDKPIPPFPLPHYKFPIDRLRHWMALQDDDAVCTSDEILTGAGGSTSNALARLADKGEFVRVEGGFKKGKIMEVWVGWEKDQARIDAHATELTKVFDSAAKFDEAMTALKSVHWRLSCAWERKDCQDQWLSDAITDLTKTIGELEPPTFP